MIDQIIRIFRGYVGIDNVCEDSLSQLRSELDSELDIKHMMTNFSLADARIKRLPIRDLKHTGEKNVFRKND